MSHSISINAAMLSDVRAYDEAKAKLAHGKEEIIPFEITERRVNSESTIKIWREYRGLK